MLKNISLSCTALFCLIYVKQVHSTLGVYFYKAAFTGVSRHAEVAVPPPDVILLHNLLLKLLFVKVPICFTMNKKTVHICSSEDISFQSCNCSLNRKELHRIHRISTSAIAVATIGNRRHLSSSITIIANLRRLIYSDFLKLVLIVFG